MKQLVSGPSLSKQEQHARGHGGNGADTKPSRAKVSLRRQAEHDFTDAILDTVSCLVIVLDRNGKVVRFNHTCEVATGYSQAEMIGLNFFEILVHEHERAGVQELFTNLDPSQFPSEKQNTWMRRDGSGFLVSWSNTVLLDSEGNVEFVIKTGKDITEQRRLEKEVETQERQFHAFMDQLPAKVFAKDRSGRLTYANSRYHEVFGFSAPELIGRRDDDFLPIDAGSRNQRNDSMVFDSGVTMEVVEVEPTPSGDRRFLSRRFLFDGEGGERLLGGVSLDITPLWETEQKLRLASNTSFDAILIMRPFRDVAGNITDFTYEFANSRAELHLLRTQQQIIGQRITEVSTGQTSLFVRDQLLEVVATGRPFETELISESDGRRGRWIHYQAHAVGETIVATVRDIHDAKMMHLELEEREERLNQAEALGRVGSYEFDPATGVTVWSRSMFDLFERSPAEGPISPDEFATMVYPEDVHEFIVKREEARRTGNPLDVHFRVQTKSGRMIHIHNAGLFTLDGEGRLLKSLGTMRDVTHIRLEQIKLDEQVSILQEAHVQLEVHQAELHRANERLSELASIDGLTGLKNNRSFYERLGFEISMAVRLGRDLTLILFDIDHFKAFNDAHGHLAGDELLVRLAAVLRATTRQSDYLARYGGEEFAIIISSTNLENGLSICENIRAAIEAEPWPKGGVTASFGCAQLNAINNSSEKLVAAADLALYRAKAAGRNTVRASVL